MSSTEDLAARVSVVKASYWYPDGETQESTTSAQTIPSDLFTHLFCAFADIDADTHKVFISLAHELIFSTFTDTVKIINVQVQTLLSVGGRNGNNSAFASMASKQESRKSFIDSWITIARSKGFHGLDLAWEYPNNEQEMKDFGDLVRDLRAAVDAESILTSKPTLLLTAAVYYSSVYNKFAYPVITIKDSLDWVNIIAYDFLGPCGDSGLKQWIKAGLPEKKVVFGFPYVGWAWTIKDNKYHGDDVAAIPGEAVSANGSINYNQIRQFIVSEPATTFYDPKVVGDYCICRTTLIGYDDIQSIVTKVSYIKTKGLLGYFAWNVGTDDDSYLSRTASITWDV